MATPIYLTMWLVGSFISAILMMIETKGFKPQLVDDKIGGFGSVLVFLFASWVTILTLLLCHILKKFL